MPIIYLSPSTQEFNPYVGGGNEEYYMNLIADAMEPYLAASGIRYVRNTPDMTAASSIRASNAGNYDFHLSIHSNASGTAAGNRQGVEIYYYPSSENSKRMAEIIEKNMKLIYLDPNNVRIVPTTTLGEVAKVRAPAVLVEVAYHDNEEDAEWIRNNINRIAEALVLSLAEYFSIPFNLPQQIYTASVMTRATSLNVRYNPSLNSQIVGKIPKGSEVVVYANLPGWALVGYNNIVGYVSSDYLK